MQSARRQVRVPIHVLIRPRAGDFCYSDREFEVMRDDIRAAKQMGMDGLVLGVLDRNRRIDVERATMLVKFARPLPVTFHRAFDLARNPLTAIEQVIATGARRILTSGGADRATDALALLSRLERAAKNRIVIMPCGGINAANVARVLRATSAREIHTSVGMSRLRPPGNGSRPSYRSNGMQPNLRSAALEKNVVKLVQQLSRYSREG
jgi:copper homeostasis protein